MKNRLSALLALILLTISVPALASAAPTPAPVPAPKGGHFHEQRSPLDWKSYPADIQALKGQLDQIRSEQKGLFEQMKSQNDTIREVRKTLSPDKQKTLVKPAKLLIQQMKASRNEIRSLRSQKHEAWDNFHQHAEGKQWSSAKSDLQTIIKQKQQILEKQRTIVKLQKQLITLIDLPQQSHVHIED
jgi:hypothetical protein